MESGLIKSLDEDSSDRAFLNRLHKKCVEEYIDYNNFTRKHYDAERYVDGVKLSKHEIKRVLRISRIYDDVFFMPIQGSFGFHPAFAVRQFSPVNHIELRKIAEEIYQAKFAEGRLFPGFFGKTTEEDNKDRDVERQFITFCFSVPPETPTPFNTLNQLVQEPRYLLKFDSNQLPDEHGFSTLSKVFSSKANLRKAELAGVEFSINYSSYDY